MSKSVKKLYGEISKVEDQADGTLKVWGIASSAAEDSDGEIITAEAMKSALPDYMKFGAIREMHQPIAAGTALEIEVMDDGQTKLCAHIVDDSAIKKVKTGVYKGFSIGGKITTRDSLKKTTITGLRLIEISLVDRPANPEAVITVFKSEVIEPKQVWTCNHAEHRHLAKAEAVTCLETDEPEDDATKVDEVVVVDPVVEPPVEAPVAKTDVKVLDIKKGMYAVSCFAEVLCTLSNLSETAFWEAECENDSSPIPALLREWVKQGAEIFKDMAKEEVDELVAGITTLPVVVALADKPEDLTKVESETDLQKAIKLSEDLATKVDALVTVNETLEKRIKTLEAQPAAPKGSIRAIEKSDDQYGSGDGGAMIQPVMKFDGTIDEEATAIKKARATAKIETPR